VVGLVQIPAMLDLHVAAETIDAHARKSNGALQSAKVHDYHT